MTRLVILAALLVGACTAAPTAAPAGPTGEELVCEAWKREVTNRLVSPATASFPACSEVPISRMTAWSVAYNDRVRASDIYATTPSGRQLYTQSTRERKLAEIRESIDDGLRGQMTDRWEVRGHVDAQNRFGGLVRSNFWAEMEQDPGSPSGWRVHFTLIDEPAVTK